MPVRNGYEVCKFVKEDPALSHIPVILLVGAFDPLDEQEAQRVGADGVLKKPFVPPDPLVSMVKSALARAGVVLGAVAAPVAPPPMPVAATAEPPRPRVMPSAPPPPPPPPAFAASPDQEFTVPAQLSKQPAPFSIEKGAQPLAFGSLLETSASEDDTVFAISPTTHVAPDRDWASSSAVEEVEEIEESSKQAGWRVSSLQETVDEIPAGQTDWREAAFSGIGAGKTHTADWAPSVEKNSLSITEEEAATLARERNNFPSLAGSRGPEDWSKAIAEVLPETPPALQDFSASEATELREVSLSTNSESEVPEPAAPEAAVAAEPAASNGTLDVNSWMAGAVSPWEAELQRASQLTATWDSAKLSPAVAVDESSPIEAFFSPGLMGAAPETDFLDTPAEQPAVEASRPEEPHVAEPTPETVSAIESLLSPITQEVLHEEAAQAVFEVQTAPQESVQSPAVTSDPAPAKTPDMDEIVAKVLARMNPEVLQAVTREILKPLVEAMIKDEIHKQ
jgi:hypothetical protein